MSASDYNDQHGGDFFPPPSTPRKVRGGIRVQATSREDARRTWWSRRWLAPIDALADPSRIERGWSYARDGQVLTLEFELGAIVARVQGTRRTPYEVRIQIAQFAQVEWLHVAEALAARASYRAQLLAGTMPDDMEAVFARLGLTLFPALEDDLAISCTCSDWATPCRHAVAACHVAGEALDREPFLALRLRGIEREVLLALVQGTLPDEPGVDVEPGHRDAAVQPSPAAGSAIDLAAFWQGRDVEVVEGGAAASIDLQPPPMDAPLVHVLGAVPMWRGVDDFVPVMRSLHRRIGTSMPALDVALGLGLDTPDDEPR